MGATFRSVALLMGASITNTAATLPRPKDPTAQGGFMAADTLRIVATMNAPEGKADELRAVLESQVEPSRSEPGCLQYQLLENLENPNQFTFIEEWRDEEALNAHTQTDHFKAGIGKLAGLLADRPELRRCRLIK
jgi:quinol monooxygenase YgiN